MKEKRVGWFVSMVFLWIKMCFFFYYYSWGRNWRRHISRRQQRIESHAHVNMHTVASPCPSFFLTFEIEYRKEGNLNLYGWPDLFPPLSCYIRRQPYIPPPTSSFFFKITIEDSFRNIQLSMTSYSISCVPTAVSIWNDVKEMRIPFLSHGYHPTIQFVLRVNVRVADVYRICVVICFVWWGGGFYWCYI